MLTNNVLRFGGRRKRRDQKSFLLPVNYYIHLYKSYKCMNMNLNHPRRRASTNFSITLVVSENHGCVYIFYKPMCIRRKIV